MVGILEEKKLVGKAYHNALVELSFDNNFVIAKLKIGDLIKPRNFMGKYVEYNVICKEKAP